METYQVGLITLGISFALGVLVYLSWKRKIRKQDAAIEMPIVLVPSGEGIECLYVATVFRDRPLERVLAHGLAYRGFGKVAVEPEGVAIYRRGENSFLIPSTNFISYGSSTAVIDKAVEKDGLVVLNWKLGDTELSTHLRFAAKANRDKFTKGLIEKYGVMR